jgi:hypothetical protein
MMMGTHDRAVDQQPFQIDFGGESLKEQVQRPSLDPPISAALHGLMVAKPLGRIAPTPA